MFMYVQKYLEWKATYAPRASVNYRIWLDRFMDITGKNVDDAGVGDIVDFNKWLGVHYQPKSVELAMVVIKNYFKFWKLSGLNCISPELIRIPKCVANSYQAINFEEYVSILTFIHPTNFWELQRMVIVRLLWDTGCRVSEITDLNVSDINPENNFCMIRTKKTSDMRKIFWTIETRLFLNTFLKERKEMNSTPALFVGRFIDGSPSKRMTTRTVQRMIKELCRKAKIEKKISPHSFRHGKAHRILEMDGNTKDVQAILGHRNPISSFTYMQWNDKEFEKRAKMFL